MRKMAVCKRKNRQIMTAQLQIKKLPQRFEQQGELFEQVFENDKFYIYKRLHAGVDYFEVFEKRQTRCIDFKTKQPTGEFKESYPKNEAFGKWAWCCKSYERALTYTNM